MAAINRNVDAVEEACRIGDEEANDLGDVATMVDRLEKMGFACIASLLAVPI